LSEATHSTPSSVDLWPIPQ
jgi:hypothetical protein